MLSFFQKNHEMKYISHLLSLLLMSGIVFNLSAQKKEIKTLQATRVSKAPKIDGDPNDLQWKDAHAATGFYMFSPGDGTPLPQAYDMEVKVVYDDFGIYVLSVMKDPDPKSIRREFSLRDQVAQADNFAVMINPFLSPNNTYMFAVSASGSQMDSNQPQKGDVSWNAVWKSEVKITDYGWVTEIAIPYSALRFQNDQEQTWAITFFRHIESKREDYSWTYIDKTKRGDVVQFLGRLTGLTNIKPPVRLSLYPYTSIVHQRYKGDNSTDFGFGMDLKYGLSESYTLDATLIPDFSDTPYDELELNLGPFEQYYAEKRQFFTEGFDLFNKGRLFYSRRIGSQPSDYYTVYNNLNSDETLIDNPEKVKLINAIKISGRNKNGLGIGFFNAITNKTEATVKNNITGKERKILTEPYANYNIFVMDYNFKGNSSVSLINTNVLRQGSARDANVTGIAWDIYGMDNTLLVGGTTAMSLINQNETYDKGFKYILHAKKSFKQHGVRALIRVYDDKFDSNDLGFTRKNNYANFDIAYSYGIIKPTKHFNVFKINFNVGFDHQYKPFHKIQRDFELNFFATNKKYLSYGMGLEYVTDAYDYYEPRVPGRYFIDKKHGGFWAFLSTDYRKTLAIDLKLVRFTKFNDPQNYVSFKIAPRLRIGNQFKINYSLDYGRMKNGKGFVDFQGDDIIFGNRQQQNITNSLGANYYFTTKAGINFNFRYYWAPVEYDDFYKLENDGSLTPIDNYTQKKDINYNIWNIDLGYVWEFAPGSKLSLLYRNSIFDINQLAYLKFDENFKNLLEQPQQHTFILKMIYYIDYNTVKTRWF